VIRIVVAGGARLNRGDLFLVIPPECDKSAEPCRGANLPILAGSYPSPFDILRPIQRLSFPSIEAREMENRSWHKAINLSFRPWWVSSSGNYAAQNLPI